MLNPFAFVRCLFKGYHPLHVQYVLSEDHPGWVVKKYHCMHCNKKMQPNVLLLRSKLNKEIK